MVVVFLIKIVLFGILYFISKNKYHDMTVPLNKKDYSLKDMMPVAFYLLEKVDYKYNTAYDTKIMGKISELYGTRDARYYLMVHWANKITSMLAALLALSFIGAAAGDVDWSFGAFALGVLALVYYLMDKELDEKIKKRHMLIQYDFPEFLNKLVLLVNAGMTLSRAWEKIVCDNKKESPLYEEIALVYGEIKSGKSEMEAYENFSRRCKTREITKFVSVVIQNLRKGNSELVSLLRLQSSECWEMRKTLAKKLGEEASTKLMLPMMIMFIGILMVVMLPAVLQLKGL